MLPQQAISIVKSTAPLVQAHAEELTRHFYRRMFSNNPEVAPYFNPGNQAQGTQQRALAGAICAYAANIDNLEVLADAVELIAQKHASLMIKPEHYPIVGENLLASIAEVLGDAASEEVITAWGEAYGLLADILTGREEQIYKENAAKHGGWTGFREFKVAKKAAESSVITSFYLVPADDGPVPDYLPGQYLTLRLRTPDGSTTMRNYSLSDKPGQGYFRISVKRETGAEADKPAGFVSNLLHDDIQVGDSLEIGPPCGEFILDIDKEQRRPLVLLAAGVGTTPLLSMLQTALDAMPNREIVFVQACLNERVQPFRKTLDALAANHPGLTVHYRYSDPETDATTRQGDSSTGFVDAKLLASLVPGRDADYYFCGPKPFMVSVHRILRQWGIPQDQVHLEFFGPREELEAAA
ncbi:MAG: NO-inducible flavohemoprotein [Halioglobus sp.]|nr:NO-inducible flavohemoprotein [Halioglobus sp.]